MRHIFSLFKKIKIEKPFLYNLQKQSIKISTRQNAIPPILWFFVKPISKLSAIIVGRGFRRWWTSLPNVKRKLFIDHLKRNKIRYNAFILTIGITGFSYYQSHLQYTPITNRKRFMLFTNEQLVEIEKLEKNALLSMYGEKIVNHNSPYSHRALRICNRLFNANKDIPEVGVINWSLTVVNGDLVNAVAFPSGEVIVFTGLLDFSLNDDELATVIAHEMAHAILQHAAEHVSYSRIIDILSISLIFFIWSFLPSDITAFLTQIVVNKFLKLALDMPYGRHLELEADKVGIKLAARACFDVRYSPSFWKRMDKLNKDEKIPEMLSTHPTNENRANELEKLVPDALKLRELCNCEKLPTRIKI